MVDLSERIIKSSANLKHSPQESCNKFLGEGMRKKNSLDVLYECFEEHHTEIIHLRYVTDFY